MNADPQQAKALFLQAVEHHDPDQWPAFLDQACSGQSELRRRVEVLLEAHREAGTAAQQPDDEGPLKRDVGDAAEQPGTIIGPYKLIEQIGEGGMGTVWMAQQAEPVKRLVAVKLIKAGMDSKQVIARFEAERQALALMDHPNIARVLDAGATGAGRPYFVMDLVKGVPMTRYCDEHHLTPRQRLELFIPVCQAVQHAHQKGIIHRDLKPSNVLVALYDGKPVPKVIDFGVAKAAGQPLTDKTLVTGFGAIVGTLEYMSPEQAEINQLDIDTRSDIYSLGVLLYELLTGSTPFSKKDLEKAGMLEMLRVIREQEPSKPSTKLSSSDALPTLSANRGTEPAKLTKLMRGELDWIVMKALEKDRSRRYETANGFAMDVQRYLADETVQACPPSAWYRFRKFARRNKGGLAVAALVLFFLVLLGSGVGWAVRDRSAREAAVEKERQDREAEAARQQGERRAKVAGQVESAFAEVDRLEGEQKWPEALVAARRAGATVTGGEADAATTERVRQRLKDLEFIDRLEQIRMREKTIVEGKVKGIPPPKREYARAFRDYGVDVEELAVEVSIGRLKARPVLTLPIAAALDEWASSVRPGVAKGDDAGWKRLVAIAHGIDPEPLRDRLRATPWPLTPETQDELRRLAESIDVRAHHPATLNRLASTLKGDPARLRILREARAVYPSDYWLNYRLAWALREQKDYEGAIRFFTVCVSLRPHEAAHYFVLSSALRSYGRRNEADVVSRKGTEVEADKSESRRHFLLAVRLRDQKKPDEAIAAYRKAIEVDPKYAYAYGVLANALRAQAKPEEAIAVYRQAMEAIPEDAGKHWREIGDILRDQKKPAEAADAYGKAIAAHRKAIEARPERAVDLLFVIGDILRGQGKPGEANAIYREAIEAVPKSAVGYAGLGKALYDHGKLDEAIAAHRKAIEARPERAVDLLFVIGDILRGQGKPGEADAIYREAIEAVPKSAVGYAGLGKALYHHGKLDEAIAAYRKAVEADPKAAGSFANLASALYKQKKWPEAIDAYHKLIELAPTGAAFYDNLGNALRAQGKLDEAIDAYSKAIELDPKSRVAAAAYSNLGNAYFDQKNLPAAILAYRLAIELDPEGYAAAAYINLGILLSQRNKLDEAIASFKKAIEVNQSVAAGAHFQIGEVLFQQNKLDEAVAAFRKAIELQPNNSPRSRRSLAWILATRPEAKLRDPKEAVVLARRAVEQDPSEMSWQYLGWIHYRTGDWKSTIEALEKSCKVQKGGTGDSGQWIVLALAHAKLAAQEGLPEKKRADHKAEARRWFEKADKQIDSWYRARPGHVIGQAIWDFRAEARELMGAKESKK